MADSKFVAYYRVSTGKQGRSGLGLEAQERTVRDRLGTAPDSIVSSFVEVETATSKRARTELAKALALCRVMGAKLIVANVSRLTRDPDFMGRLVAADVEVEFCDLPNTDGPAGRFMLRQMLSVAELETGMVAERTRKALAAAKVRGVKLGGNRGNLPAVARQGYAASLIVRQRAARQRAADLAPIVSDITAGGAATLQAVADELNARGIPTARGGLWTPTQVSRIKRLDYFNPK